MTLGDDIRERELLKAVKKTKMRCPHCNTRLYDVEDGAISIKVGKKFYTIYGDVIVDCECGTKLDLNIGAR